METRGVELPKTHDEPLIGHNTEFFLQATVHLFSCRQIGMDIGPVPWTAIYNYCLAVNYPDWEKMFNIISIVDSDQRKDREKH